jgi:hypothetical protein
VRGGLRGRGGCSRICAYMTNTNLQCDGCGQIADAAHIARRLKRLEQATRYRPVHIQALVLGGIAPKNDAEFLYAPDGLFAGEAGAVLLAAGISMEGKTAEVVLAEFQKLGLMLAHVLECPVGDGADRPALMEKQLGAVFARIRRSLKPKRVVLVSEEMRGMAGRFREAELGCGVVLAEGERLRGVLAG